MQGADESEVLLSTDRLHPDRTQSGVNHAEVMHEKYCFCRHSQPHNCSNFFDSTQSACLLTFTSGKTEVFPTMMMLVVCSLGLPTSSLKLECYANILGDVKPCSYVIVNYHLYKYADLSLLTDCDSFSLK